jgi:hypothetical protein
VAAFVGSILLLLVLFDLRSAGKGTSSAGLLSGALFSALALPVLALTQTISSTLSAIASVAVWSAVVVLIVIALRRTCWLDSWVWWIGVGAVVVRVASAFLTQVVDPDFMPDWLLWLLFIGNALAPAAFWVAFGVGALRRARRLGPADPPDAFA